MEGGSSFRLLKDLRDRCDAGESMYLEACHLKDGHVREALQQFAERGEESIRGVFCAALFDSSGATGEEDAGRHAFYVPLEGAAHGLVEIIDIADEPAVGTGVGSQVLDVSVATELGVHACFARAKGRKP